jgi:orotidine-5'-phosphate decarboxylase
MQKKVNEMKYNNLIAQIQAKRSFLCVGLDSDRSLLPPHLKHHGDALFLFNKEIIDATAPHTVAYKPNTAFYEAEGVNGWRQLADTVQYIRHHYPDILIIADAKRGDIGHTAQRYAKAFFEELNVDAVTLAPYMGADSIEPFLQYKDKWTIILALTSNPSAADFEFMVTKSGKRVYEEVIEQCSRTGTKEQVMFVVGATRPQKLLEIRKLIPDHFLLVPGVGAQGGTVAEVAKYGMNAHCGLLVNLSRDIIYAGSGEDFAQAAANKAAEIAKEMGKWLQF